MHFAMTQSLHMCLCLCQLSVIAKCNFHCVLDYSVPIWNFINYHVAHISRHSTLDQNYNLHGGRGLKYINVNFIHPEEWRKMATQTTAK